MTLAESRVSNICNAIGQRCLPQLAAVGKTVLFDTQHSRRHRQFRNTCKIECILVNRSDTGRNTDMCQFEILVTILRQGILANLSDAFG